MTITIKMGYLMCQLLQHSNSWLSNMPIAILFWGSHNLLVNTVHPYNKYDLPIYDPERIIFFQEIYGADTKLAKRYHYEYIGTKENVGIAEGYRRLVERATGDLFLFLDNDWELINYRSSALSDARFLIS